MYCCAGTKNSLRFVRYSIWPAVFKRLVFDSIEFSFVHYDLSVS